MPYNSSTSNGLCLIIDPVHECLFPLLEKTGLEYLYLPEISIEEFESYLPQITGVVVRSRYVLTKEYLEKAPQLKFIARAGAGVDLIDLKQAEKQKITLINAPEGNRDALGEHAVGMLLALINNFQISDRQIRNGIWKREENRGQELGEMTVGLVGYGNMGQATAKRLSSFGCRILVYDRFHKNFGHSYIEEVSWEKLKQEADVLSLHIPLSNESKFWLTNEEIDQFEKPFYFLNTARGEIVSLETIRHGLSTGKIKGAALDVLENEKLNKLSESQKSHFEWLTKQDNILFTPHVGGWTYSSFRKISETLGEKIANYLAYKK